MRYYYSFGVGHIHVHRPTSASSASSCITTQPMDVESSDNVPEANEDPGVTTANYEFAYAEMVLEECDPDGWDDVESDTSEGGSNDYDSEEDFGDIYESLNNSH
jgi:hypothetical protein